MRQPRSGQRRKGVEVPTLGGRVDHAVSTCCDISLPKEATKPLNTDLGRWMSALSPRHPRGSPNFIACLQAAFEPSRAFTSQLPPPREPASVEKVQLLHIRV